MERQARPQAVDDARSTAGWQDPLIANGINARRYWSSGNRAEVDFLIQRGADIIPVEVKADTNIRGRSLVEYEKKYSPSLRIRFSMLNLSMDESYEHSLVSC